MVVSLQKDLALLSVSWLNKIMMTRIIIVRHGQTKWNVGQIFRGRVDVPLNKTGKKQVQSLAAALSPYKISAIYCSPLSRARETAEIVAKTHRLEPKISNLLLDISYGKWQGLSHKEVVKKWPKVYKLWHEAPHKIKFPEGESLAEVRKRVEKFLDKVVSEHRGKTVVAISHRVAIKVLLCAALGLDNSYFGKFKQNTASFSILECENGTFSLTCFNEICHLKGVTQGIDKVDF